MPSWPFIVKEMVVNLKFLALGASPVPGLLAPGVGGHFWVGGLGGLGLRKGRVGMGLGYSVISSPGSSAGRGKDLETQSRMVTSRCSSSVLTPVYPEHDLRLGT